MYAHSALNALLEVFAKKHIKWINCSICWATKILTQQILECLTLVMVNACYSSNRRASIVRCFHWFVYCTHLRVCSEAKSNERYYFLLSVFCFFVYTCGMESAAFFRAGRTHAIRGIPAGYIIAFNHSFDFWYSRIKIYLKTNSLINNIVSLK